MKLNFKYKYFGYLSIYVYLCAIVLGLGPHIFNRSTNQFETSRILQWYSVFAGAFIIYWNYVTEYTVVANIDSNYKLLSPDPFIRILQLMEVTNLVFNYLAVLILNRNIINAKNKIMTCGSEIFLCVKEKYVNLSFKYFLVFVFKEILLKWVIFVANVLALRMVTNHQITIIEVILNRSAQFVAYLISSHFIANLMNSIHLYEVVNSELAEILIELKHKQNEIGNIRLLIMCDTLDRLCDFHCKITHCFKRLIMVFSMPMLMQMSFLFVNIVVYAYLELMLEIMNFSKRVTSENLRLVRICGVFTLSLSLIQLFSYVILSSAVIQKSRKAGQLLSSFTKLNVFHGQLASTVESFSLSLEQNKFEISICGLFVVNYELMYAMAASMTSYLIILVQYQLEFSKSA